jgi:hypothetical protein
MNDRERNRYNMLVKVQQFGVENSFDTPNGSIGAESLVEIASGIEGLRTHSAVQTSNAATQTSNRKSALRDAIRNKLKTISRTAKAIAIDKTEFNQVFRSPTNNNDQMLISTARSFAVEAAKIKADFIRYGLSDDFIDELNDDISQFEQTLSDSAATKIESTSAVAAIDENMRKSMNAFYRLDAFYKNIYRNNPVKLAAWTLASHVERIAKKKKETEKT